MKTGLSIVAALTVLPLIGCAGDETHVAAGDEQYATETPSVIPEYEVYRSAIDNSFYVLLSDDVGPLMSSYAQPSYDDAADVFYDMVELGQHANNFLLAPGEANPSALDEGDWHFTLQSDPQTIVAASAVYPTIWDADTWAVHTRGLTASGEFEIDDWTDLCGLSLSPTPDGARYDLDLYVEDQSVLFSAHPYETEAQAKADVERLVAFGRIADNYEVATFDDGSDPYVVLSADTGETLLVSPSFATPAEAEAVIPAAAAALAAEPEGCRIDPSATERSMD